MFVFAPLHPLKVDECARLEGIAKERVIDRFGKISRPSSQEFALVTEEVKNSLKIGDTVTEHGD